MWLCFHSKQLKGNLTDAFAVKSSFDQKRPLKPSVTANLQSKALLANDFQSKLLLTNLHTQSTLCFLVKRTFDRLKALTLTLCMRCTST